jgi:Domain of unknown function (4846)
LSFLTATYTPRVIGSPGQTKNTSNIEHLSFCVSLQLSICRKNRPLLEGRVLFRKPVQYQAALPSRLLGRRSPSLTLLVLLVGVGCKHPSNTTTGSDRKSPVTASASASASVASAASVRANAVPSEAGALADAGLPSGSSVGAAPDAHRYRWLAADNLKFPAAVDSLQTRFPPPPGYQRVAVAPGSFAEWLRDLPLAAPSTPVLNNSGDTVFAGEDDYVAAVAAIDVGAGDLQQSADAIVRLNGEWLWASDKPDAISYRSATKLDMPFSRWAKGQRLLASGPNVFWVVKTKPHVPTYGDFRQYIDAVMLWTNNVSLATRAVHVSDPKQLSAGDFFLQTHGKGHALLVLDVAQKPTGERVALLGQALQSPAQSFHVIRLGHETAWFSMRPPNAVLTPRSDEFSWDELSRLEPKKED